MSNRVEDEAATQQYLLQMSAIVRDLLLGYPEKELLTDPKALLLEVSEHLNAPELLEGLT